MPYISCDEAFCEEKAYTGHDCYADHWVAGPDWMVFDIRNGNTQGPFSMRDAQKLANDLNMFVFENTLGGALPRPSSIKGPFYIREVA